MEGRNLKIDTQCYHCGDGISGRPVQFDDRNFCCEGCKTVYSILNKSDLCEYYHINNHPGISQKKRYRKDKFAFLDLVEVQQKLVQYSDAEQVHVTFYLPQMHCSSCLWLLENINKLNKGILSSTVNFNKKEVFIIYHPKSTSLRKVVESLSDISYEPHISLDDLDRKKAITPNRSRLYKIGVAGFCFSNVMMLSVPEYVLGAGELEKDIALVFNVLKVSLAIPILFYSASEFFISAWQGLKHKYLNIDAPIALALIVTFGRSLYELFSGTGEGYLDSMSGIVFFMLLGRWLQDRTQQAVSFDRDFKSFFPIAVNVLKDGNSVPTTVDKIREDDLIQIHSQEIIPVDGILSKGNALIDYSFVSGESVPVLVSKGEIVYAGGKQTGAKIELLVVKEVSQSYLTNLWNKETDTTEKETTVIDTISTYFTYVVFLIGIIAGAYWYMHDEIGLMWNAWTTILIVACPCALLLSSNFTNGNILRILSLNKFYLRSPHIIEKMSNISHVVFDKTGTLTQRRRCKITYEGQILSIKEHNQIAAILSQYSHPSTDAILEYLECRPDFDVKDFKLIEGKGVEAWVDEHYFKIGSADFLGLKNHTIKDSQVVVAIDGDIKGVFHISNVYRFGIFELIQKMKNSFQLSVISGDNDSEGAVLKEYFEKDDLLFYQKPDDKLRYIQHLQTNKHANVMMIGDGLNDAGALRQSDIGIAITDSDNNFTPASDGIIDAQRISNLDKFMTFARDGRKIIGVSFFVSILYNIVGLYFAVQGILSPLIAAILMPSSSISIILITYGMSEWMAKYRGLSNFKMKE
ncbi:MAG: heavy metal translocating P-type ATPase metal-binding domain-containing protein [Chitinophagales bacterium]|nr:heavy metal translocating P-type ATPase metal-binding domain-containing protein [Chitinophagales bacterium]MCZ2392343.1 heavy metal translocating P-type ATPase metal-binding domain-containing protein [Chitinophagales bacterium]